jgi:hypothetical protein
MAAIKRSDDCQWQTDHIDYRRFTYERDIERQDAIQK